MRLLIAALAALASLGADGQNGRPVSQPPFGAFDAPAQIGTGVSGTVVLGGWALDDDGIEGVRIYRNCFTFDRPGSCSVVTGRSVVFIGDALQVPGARPDVQALYSNLPRAGAAGWGYLLLTNLLPHVPARRAGGGEGVVTIYAIATDSEGQTTELGSRTFDLANDNASRPFGSIDTPAPGQEVSGVVANFGWALTPGAARVPVDGTGITVYVDGLPAGRASYGHCRGPIGNPAPPGRCDDDVAAVFPAHSNIALGTGAVGVFLLDTRQLPNGVHSLSWGVRDDFGREDGIGSRYFRVRNPPGVLRIMPLGDSITHGDDGRASYRYWLYRQLSAAGYGVDFVGSMKGSFRGVPLYADFDQDHEGHWGWSTADVARQIDGWVLSSAPDVVLLHLGTNDALRGLDLDEAAANLRAIVAALRQRNGSVTILLAQVIGTLSPRADTAGLNSRIAALAASLSTPSSPVVLVDQFSGFDPAADTYDGVHPNESGERKLATRWYQALERVLPRPAARVP